MQMEFIQRGSPGGCLQIPPLVLHGTTKILSCGTTRQRILKNSYGNPQFQLVAVAEYPYFCRWH